MFRKNQNNKIYILIALFLIVLFSSKIGLLSSLKLRLVNDTSGPLKLLKFPVNEAKKILFYHRTFDEYKKLRKEVNTLNARVSGLREVIRENARLETLLKFKQRLVYSSVAANIIGRNPSLWNSTMIIDKGLNAGVKKGMPVVNASGVVGKIVDVSKNTSKVMLITDPQFSVAALVQRPREHGLVSGTLEGLCRLRYINENTDIKIGDNIVTSQISSSFPEGLIIGKVTEMRESHNKPSPDYLVKPAVNVSKIEEVLVIISETKE